MTLNEKAEAEPIPLPEALPCPFCGWENIRVIEEKAKKGLFRGEKYTYCWCKPCGTRGPWAWNLVDDDLINAKKSIERWNERVFVK